MMDKSKNYLTIEQAAEVLGVEYKTVYRLVRSGEIPAGRIGRVYRILKGDLEGYFEGQKQILSGGPREYTHCGVCGQQMVSELSVAGHCNTCGRPICPACWSVKKQRTCPQHSTMSSGARSATSSEFQTHADRVAELRKDGRSVVTGEESPVIEATFVREFFERMAGLTCITDPVTGLEMEPASARTRHEEGPGVSGRFSRFVFRTGGWGKPKVAVAIEGQYMIHAEALAKQGYDAEPVTRIELQEAVNLLTKEQNKVPMKGVFRVVQLGSPTGFSEDAIEWVCSGKANGSNLAIGLVDLASGEFYCSLGESRLVSFSPLLSPMTWLSELARAVAAIEEILSTQKSLTLANAISRLELSPCVTRAAFTQLGTESYALDELDDLGLVISRTDS